MGLSVSPLSIGINRALGLGNPILKAYSVGGITPTYVYDPVNDFYFADGTTQTRDAIAPHSRTTLATQVDSDGLVKWGAHNLLTYSEDFSTGWATSNSSVAANVTTAPNGTLTADRITSLSTSADIRRSAPSIAGGGSYRVFARVVDLQWLRVFLVGLNKSVWFDVENGLVGVEQGSLVGSIVEKGGGWYLCSVEVPDFSSVTDLFMMHAASDGNSVEAIGSFDLWGAHIYRSDLGGMVNNPATGNSYVPTTTTAKYLLRQHHHVYNGTAWVDQGDLVEREARTNLFTYSNALSVADWITGKATLSDNELIEEAVFGSHLVANVSTSSVTASTLATFWIDVERGVGTRNVALVANDSISSSTDLAHFDLGDGSVLYVRGTATASTIPLAGGGYRCIVTYTTPASTTNLQIRPLNGTESAYTGDGSSSLIIHRTQFEEGSTPSSYIPTAGSTVTRAADSSLATPAALAPYDSTALSLVMKGAMTYADEDTASAAALWVWEDTAAEQINCTIGTAGGRTGEIIVRHNNANTAASIRSADPTGLSPGVNTPYRTATRIVPSGGVVALHGITGATVSDRLGMPAVSAADLEIAENLMGTVSLVLGFAGTGLTDAQLEEASSRAPVIYGLPDIDNGVYSA